MNLLFSCIGRRGYIADCFRAHLRPTDRIIGTSNTAWTSGFSACDLGVVLPDIVDPNYVPTLLSLCRRQQVQALLSFFDLDVDTLSRHRDAFRAIGVLPILPSAEVSDICLDKYHSYLFLKKHGFRAPETFVDLEQAFRAVNEGVVTFPLMVKPRRGFGSRNLFCARNVKELEVFFQYDSDMLIQEMLTGQEHHLDILNDLHGQVLAVVPKRKVAMRSGETDQAEICDAPGLIDFGVHLGTVLGRLGHVGPLDVDLFLQDNQYVILELNPRFGGGYPLSHLAGADFPRLVLSMIRGEAVDPQLGRFETGVVMMKEYNILGGKASDLFGPTLDMSKGQGTVSYRLTGRKCGT